MKKSNFSLWATVITLVLLAMFIASSWGEVVKAWHIMASINLWVLAILAPVKIGSCWAMGKVLLLYLNKKGDLQSTSSLSMARTFLEVNFVSHFIPMPGLAGISYLSWVLHHKKVNASESAMAQIVKQLLVFVISIVFLIVGVLILIINKTANGFTIIICLTLICLSVFGSWLLIFIVNSPKRVTAFSDWLIRVVNGILSKLKRKHRLKTEPIESFFNGINQDYIAIRSNIKLLAGPLIWATLATVFDAIVPAIAFWSLGVWVNPVITLMAFMLASTISILAITPGGAGVYETVMIGFLCSTGMSASIAIAGTLLARIAVLGFAILSGYIPYQATVLKYGKAPAVSPKKISVSKSEITNQRHP